MIGLCLDFPPLQPRQCNSPLAERACNVPLLIQQLTLHAISRFKRTELLSKVLQSSSISVTSAMKAAEQTQANLEAYRSDETWATLWASCTSDAIQLNLDAPTVPRVRRPPRRFDVGDPPCIQSVEEYHRVVFFNFWITLYKRLVIVCSRKQ